MAFPGHTRSFALSQSRESQSNDAIEISTGWSRDFLDLGSLRSSPLEDDHLSGSYFDTVSRKKSQHVGSEFTDQNGTGYSKSILIDNLPHGLSKSALKNAMSRYGKIEHMSYADKQGNATIDFTTVAAAVKAWKKSNNSDIFQRNLINGVRFAESTNYHATGIEARLTRPIATSAEPSEALTRNLSMADHEKFEKTVEWPNGVPPTGPKSQKRKVSPPPLRRGDSYRPRQSRDSGRRNSARDDDKRGHDIYRPSYRHDADMIDKSRQSESTLEIVSKTPSLITDGTTPEAVTTSSRSSYDQIEHTYNSIEQTPNLDRHKSNPSLPNESDVLVQEQALDVTPTYKTLSGNPKHDPNGRHPAVKESYHILDASAIGAPRANISVSLSPSNPFSLPQASALRSPALEGIRLDMESVPPAMLGVSRFRSPLQRLKQQADDASSVMSDKTSSSISSARRKKCADCKKPESSLAALIVCTRCPRRFHSTCGNPRPSLLSISTFICGRCLKKQKTNGHKASITSKPNVADESLAEYEPSGKITSDDSFSPADIDGCPVNQCSTPEETSMQAATLSAATSSENFHQVRTPSRNVSFNLDGAASDMRIPNLNSSFATNIDRPDSIVGPGSREQQTYIIRRQDDAEKTRLRYKTVTCPWWQKDNVSGCSVAETECMFAHQDTGIVSPNGFAEAKSWTCRVWYASGNCPKGEQDCKYAHEDTGLYVGIDGKASKKHMTCYYWRTQGQCNKPESKCIYAHADTGIYVTDPCKAAQTYVRHSASSSMNSHVGRVSDVILNGFVVPKSPGYVKKDQNSQHISNDARSAGISKYDAVLVKSPSENYQGRDRFPFNTNNLTNANVSQEGFFDAVNDMHTEISPFNRFLTGFLSSPNAAANQSQGDPKSIHSPGISYQGSPTAVKRRGYITDATAQDDSKLNFSDEQNPPLWFASGKDLGGQLDEMIKDPRKLKQHLSKVIEQNAESPIEEDDYEPPEPMDYGIVHEPATIEAMEEVSLNSEEHELRKARKYSLPSVPPGDDQSLAESVREVGQDIGRPLKATTTVPGLNKCKICSKTILKGDLCVTCKHGPGLQLTPASETAPVAISAAKASKDPPEVISLEDDNISPETTSHLEDAFQQIKQIKRKKSEDAMFVMNKRPKPNPKASYNSTAPRSLNISSSNEAIHALLQQTREKKDRQRTDSTTIDKLSLEKDIISPSTESNKENQLPLPSANNDQKTSSAEIEQSHHNEDLERSSSEEPIAQTILRRRNLEQEITAAVPIKVLTKLPKGKSPPLRVTVDNVDNAHRDNPDTSDSETDHQSEWHTPKSQLGGSIDLSITAQTARLDRSTRRIRSAVESFEIKTSTSTELNKPKPACRDCNRRHKKCLHDTNGTFDGEKCYFWLQERLRRGRKSAVNERGTDERTAIEQAAEAYETKLKYGRRKPTTNSEPSEVSESNSIDGDLGSDEGESTKEASDDGRTMSDTLVNGKRGGRSFHDAVTVLHTYPRRRSISYFDSEPDELALSEPPKISSPSKSDRNLSQPQRPSIPPIPRPANGSKRTEDVSQQGIRLQEKIQEWTKRDEIAAISHLRQRGVVFESDDEDEDYHENPVPQLSQPVRRPSPVDLSIDPLRARCRTSTDFYALFPEEHPKIKNRPPVVLPRITKGQGLKQSKLVRQRRLQYNRERFGNPFWEVDRRLPESTVETVVERKIRPKGNDAFAPDIVERTTEEISFRAFLGLPSEIEACLIGQGRGAILAFREAPSKLEKDFGIFARKRRVGDGEKWPVQDRLV